MINVRAMIGWCPYKPDSYQIFSNTQVIALISWYLVGSHGSCFVLKCCVRCPVSFVLCYLSCLICPVSWTPFWINNPDDPGTILWHNGSCFWCYHFKLLQSSSLQSSLQSSRLWEAKALCFRPYIVLVQRLNFMVNEEYTCCLVQLEINNIRL